MTKMNELSKRLTQGPTQADIEQAALAIELHAAAISEAKLSLLAVMNHAKSMAEHLESVSTIMRIDDAGTDHNRMLWQELVRLRVDRDRLQHQIQDLQQQIAETNNRNRPPYPGVEPGGDPNAPTIPMFQ